MAADLLFVTDLDGCLLDDQTYRYDAAVPALEALARNRIPLVLCSSKTRAEMQPLAHRLPTVGPFIVENGGAIVVPAGHLPRLAGRRDPEGYGQVMLGTHREALVRALAELANQTGARVRGFSSLSADEVAGLTGLEVPAAERALRREYDEPFLLDAGSEERLTRAAAARGLRITRGGRFHHLLGPVDKGRALQRLLALYAAEGLRFAAVVLGDSPNDLSMLQRADRPILIPRAATGTDASLAAALPHAEIAPAPGPTGWNDAVLTVLRGALLARLSG